MSTVSIRFMSDDVPAAISFYTTNLGLPVEQDASAAFASVMRDGVRLLLSGKQGLWSAAHEARTDFAMLLGLIFLLIQGGGRWSFDKRLSSNRGR